jgi:mannose-6-phosphate isomerase-like protein (cupin superfamily)
MMKNLEIEAQLSKTEIFSQVEKEVLKLGFQIVTKDMDRPWGGFFVLDETQIAQFRAEFFPEVELSEDQLSHKLSPKFLLVAPSARLSWQYHFRRAELWKLIAGEGAISKSYTDEQGPVEELALGEVVNLQQGQRHRLIGTKNWGIVAEIWMHTDPSNPSDESDIVRLQDDYARK